MRCCSNAMDEVQAINLGATVCHHDKYVYLLSFRDFSERIDNDCRN